MAMANIGNLKTFSGRLKQLSLVLLIALPVTLAGCGQKGDLYVPKKAASQQIQQA